MVIKNVVPSLSETTLRIGATMALPAVLRHLGEDPELLFSEVGIDISLFDNPDNRISYIARGNLLAHCVAKTGCTQLGLMIGQHTGLTSLGLVGLLVKYSSDVNTALEYLSRYMYLHVRGASVFIEHDDKLVTVAYITHHPNTNAADQVGDGAVAIIFNVMRELCGAEWKPLEVHFIHKKPDDIHLYRSFFKAPLVFDSSLNSVVFDAKWLSYGIPASDNELRRLLQIQIDQIEDQHSMDFPEQVRSILKTAIITNHASAKQIAALFSIHSRTLNRRLSEHGLSFQKLLDEGRFMIAKQMLEYSHVDIATTAETLGFADASSFTRTFKRWSGTTPSQWRIKHDR
jgi:AraC-like DNA-binding protein